MGRKSTTEGPLSSPHDTNQAHNNDINGLYRKRLRSWKQKSTQSKSNHATNNKATPLHRSTVYTYPINLIHDRQNTFSRTILSESSTTESAFYGPSVSYTSIPPPAHVNNNHVTTMNIENRKRKNDPSSCESLVSEFSQIKAREILNDTNDGKNIYANRSSNDNLRITYYQNPTKRSRLSTDNSIITTPRSSSSPISIHDDTIDINQHEPLLSSVNNESLINTSTSMEAAVKMVQPIVDIIFNAFEDQLKQAQSKSIQSSLSNASSICSPMIIPYFPLASPPRPIILHAVNINIQLTTKQPTVNFLAESTFNAQHLPHIRLTENDNSQSTSLTVLKEKVVSYILSTNFVTHYGTRRQFKRLVQLTVVGVSVLCGYFLF